MINRKSIFIAMGLIVLTACQNYSQTESGLRYKILNKSANKALPEKGEYLQCYYSITNSEDSIIFSNFGQTPDRILLTNPTHSKGDIMEALGMMSEGDSAMFLINADSFYFKTRMEAELPSYIQPKSDLKFLIKMDRRLTKYQKDSLVNAEKIQRWSEEIVNINKYIKKQSLEMKIDTASGIRYQFHKVMPDTAKRINDGDIVRFHFIGKLMDGTEFFNTYTYGQPQSIRMSREQFEPMGMYEMLNKMKEGEKATFILPYDLAFGAKGVEGMIAPYSTLVYEIYVLKVQ
jgi:FKBP-type peptidyl-prolyl cis-trans isomerase